MSENKDKRILVNFDWAMKSILKQPQHFDVLEGFLAALLGDKDIKILEILESESTQRDEDDKFNRVDLKAKDGAGKGIIIELDFAKMSPQEQSDYDYYWNISRRSALNTIDAAKKEERIAMAKEMLTNGEPINKIIKYTKLTENEIKDINHSGSYMP